MPAKMVAANLPSVTEADLGSTVSPLGQPLDVAYLVLYLASDESRFFSGQKLIMDNTASVTLGSVPGSGSLAGQRKG